MERGVAVQLPRQLQTLDGLLAETEHYADYSIRNSGRVPPTLFRIGADGPSAYEGAAWGWPDKASSPTRRIRPLKISA